MTTLGLYIPRESKVHRAPAGAKLTGLIAAGIGCVFVEQPWQVALALTAVLGCYRLAQIPSRTALAQLRPLLWIVAGVAVFHLLATGWKMALVAPGLIATLVLLAGLVTLTTRTHDMIETIVSATRPLRGVGINPDRLGLLLALSIRAIPVVVGLAEEIRDAQRARGLALSPRAFAVPLIVRALRHADTLADALVARGIHD